MTRKYAARVAVLPKPLGLDTKFEYKIAFPTSFKQQQTIVSQKNAKQKV